MQPIARQPNISERRQIDGSSLASGTKAGNCMESQWKRQWLDLVAPEEPHKLARRLAWDEITEENFQQALQTSANSKDNNGIQWKECLEECCEAIKCSWNQPLLPVAPEDNQRAFEDLWHPIRNYELKLLKDELKDKTNINNRVYENLADSLLKRLCDIGEQVLWEAFNNQRKPGTMLLAHLGIKGDGAGPPTRENYESFIFLHRKNGLNALLKDYSELGRFIGTVVMLWRKSSGEMLQRIEMDRQVIDEVFGISKDQPLTSVEQGLSDPHRGGRAVAILSFSDQKGYLNKLIYKPKDMAVDVAYHNLIETINKRSKNPSLRRLNIYNGKTYGYMEYVKHKLAKDSHEINRFYKNAGKVTAILHLLGCTDCHHENLIACGDQLNLIDTETLLEGEVHNHISTGKDAKVGDSILRKRFNESVLRSGLMPQWMFIGGLKVAIDISALGISPPKEKKREIVGWLGLNSDGMMPGKIEVDAEIPTSLPNGIGEQNEFGKNIDTFCEGFAEQTNEIIKMRDKGEGEKILLDPFKGLRRRIVLRATRVYFSIQKQQLEPSALKSALNSAIKLEQLTRSFLLAEEKPMHWSVYSEEVKQMQQLDIPFFTHKIDSSSLELDEKGSLLSGYIKTSGLDAAKERLINLDEEEINFQLQLIRGTQSAQEMRNITTTVNKGNHESEKVSYQDLDSPEKCHKAAVKIMDKISDLAITDKSGHIEWLGMDLGADAESFTFGPVGLTLYGGSSGIAILDRELRILRGETAVSSELQRKIISSIDELCNTENDDMRLRWWRDQPLGICGCGGILLALKVLGHQKLAEKILKAGRKKFIAADTKLDLLGGSAGLIGAMVNIKSEMALDLATCAGDHLLDKQSHEGSWQSTEINKRGILGFSHGTAGYAASLARLHNWTGEERYLIGAQNALSHERSCFDTEEQNWPDKRYENDTKFMTSWCHGAPGIALGRACLWQTAAWDEQCIKEIEIAALTTAKYVKNIGSDNLCCGKLGMTTILETLVDGPWGLESSVSEICKQQVKETRNEILDRYLTDEAEYNCIGTKNTNLLQPGFYTGLSGMALALIKEDHTKKTTIQLLTGGLME